MVKMEYFVLRFLDDDVQPDAQIGGHHMHQTETSQSNVAAFHYLHLNKAEHDCVTIVTLRR